MEPLLRKLLRIDEAARTSPPKRQEIANFQQEAAGLVGKVKVWNGKVVYKGFMHRDGSSLLDGNY